jgi:hypothetical protein
MSNARYVNIKVTKNIECTYEMRNARYLNIIKVTSVPFLKVANDF